MGGILRKNNVELNAQRWFELEDLENEVWKDLKVYKKGNLYDYKNLYKVSNYGRVKSLGIYHGKTNNYFEKEHILKGRTNKFGYVMYCLYKYGKRNEVASHRIVASTFIDNKKNKPQVNHINGDKTDNRVENLEWCTSKENIEHAYNSGLKISNGVSLPREKNPNSRFTQLQIDEIREKRKNGVKLKELAKEYNTFESYICRICKNYFWQ